MSCGYIDRRGLRQIAILSGDSGDIMVLVSHVILQDHVIKYHLILWVRCPLWFVNTRPSLVAIRIMVVEM